MRVGIGSLAAAILVLTAPAVSAAPQAGIGDTVWAQSRPNVWVHGTVDKPCPLGLHVVFDTGDERCVPAALAAVDAAPRELGGIGPGTRTLARWTDGKFYPATVMSVAAGRVEVRYDDRDAGKVAPGDLRLLPDPAPPRKAAAGDVVWAQWKPNAWYHGKVDETCDLGLYVAFDDGDEGCYPPGLVAVDAPPATAPEVAARVLALWTDGRFYPATVAGAEGGAFAVRYDDGAAGSVAQKDLRLLSPGQRPPVVAAAVAPAAAPAAVVALPAAGPSAFLPTWSDGDALYVLGDAGVEEVVRAAAFIDAWTVSDRGGLAWVAGGRVWVLGPDDAEPQRIGPRKLRKGKHEDLDSISFDGARLTVTLSREDGDTEGCVVGYEGCDSSTYEDLPVPLPPALHGNGLATRGLWQALEGGTAPAAGPYTLVRSEIRNQFGVFPVLHRASAGGAGARVLLLDVWALNEANGGCDEETFKEDGECGCGWGETGSGVLPGGHVWASASGGCGGGEDLTWVLPFGRDQILEVSAISGSPDGTRWLVSGSVLEPTGAVTVLPNAGAVWAPRDVARRRRSAAH